MRKCKEKTLHSIARARKGNYDFVPKFQPPPRININHDIVRQMLQNAQKQMWGDMEDYLKNIINSPSTINRIMKYYYTGRMDNPDGKEYIVFVRNYDEKVTIVREFDIYDYVSNLKPEQVIEFMREYVFSCEIQDILKPPIHK